MPKKRLTVLDALKKIIHKDRIRILQILRDYGPLSFSDIRRLTGIKSNTLPYNLEQLEKTSVIESSEEGSEYWITEKGIKLLSMLERILTMDMSLKVRHSGRTYQFDMQKVREMLVESGLSSREIRKILSRMIYSLRQSGKEIISGTMIRLILAHVMVEKGFLDKMDKVFAAATTMSDVKEMLQIPPRHIYSEIGKTIVARYITGKMLPENIVRLNNENMIRILKLSTTGIMFSRFIHSPFSFKGDDILFDLIKNINITRDVVRGEQFIPHLNYYLAPVLESRREEIITSYFKILFYSNPAMMLGIGIDLDLPESIKDLPVKGGEGTYSDYIDEAMKVASLMIKFIASRNEITRNYLVINAGYSGIRHITEDVFKLLHRTPVYFSRISDIINIPSLAVPDNTPVGVPLEVVLNLSEISKHSKNENIFFDELQEVISRVADFANNFRPHVNVLRPLRTIYPEDPGSRIVIGYVGLPECTANITRLELGLNEHAIVFAINTLHYIKRYLDQHEYLLYQYHLDHFLGEIVPENEFPVNSANVDYRVPLGKEERIKIALYLNQHIRETIQLPCLPVQELIENALNNGIRLLNFYGLPENGAYCMEKGYTRVDKTHKRLLELELEGKKNMCSTDDK